MRMAQEEEKISPQFILCKLDQDSYFIMTI